MAQDRFVTWVERKPTREDLHNIIKDYLGDACLDFQSKEDRFLITLPGYFSLPFQKVGGPKPWAEHGTLRYIEIYVDTKYVDVITRMADEFTNVVADGLAQALTRFYEAKLET